MPAQVGPIASSAAAPGVVLDGPPRRDIRLWFGLAVLLTGNFVTILDLFIVNVALESIKTNLHTTLAQMQLVVVAYSVAYGVSLMNGARLGDLYGRRRIFLAGMTTFALASAVCGLAPTPWALIGARALQGVGAALLMPQVFASLRVLFEGEQRRRAFAAMGAVQGVAASISQVAGGYLIEHGPWHLGWRLVFLVNVPIGVLAVLAGRFLIRETRAEVAPKLDVKGAAMAALGLLLVLVPLMEGRQYGWPWWSVGGPLLALPVFVDFVRHERRLSARKAVPVIDMNLFRNGNFVAGVAAIFLFYSTISSFFLSLTLLLQFGLGLSPLVAGEIFTPSAVAFFAGALVSHRLAARLGHGALLTGVLIFTAGLALAVMLGAFSPANMPVLIISLVLNGLGQGIAIPLALGTILSGVPDEHAGISSGVVSTMQLVGTSFGVAVVGVLFFSLITSAATGVGASHVTQFGHAFAMATIYNVIAASSSFAMFLVLVRRERSLQRC